MTMATAINPTRPILTTKMIRTKGTTINRITSSSNTAGSTPNTNSSNRVGATMMSRGY